MCWRGFTAPSHQQPLFWHPCRGQVLLPFPFPDLNFLGCGCTVSWHARPRGCSPTALCHSDPPGDTGPTLIPIPQQPARGRNSANPIFPGQGSALPAAGLPQDPAEPCLVGCHPAARPRWVPRAGRQAMPQAALTGRFVLCGLGCPAGRQKGQSDAGEHCAGSHALRQQPAPPRSPRDPRRPGLCPPWCPRACRVRPMGAPREKGAVGLGAVVTAGPRPPRGPGRCPGCGVVVVAALRGALGLGVAVGTCLPGPRQFSPPAFLACDGRRVSTPHGDRQHVLAGEAKQQCLVDTLPSPPPTGSHGEVSLLSPRCQVAPGPGQPPGSPRDGAVHCPWKMPARSNR